MHKPKAVHIVDDFYAVEETNWKPVNKKGYVINKWGQRTKGFRGDYYRTNISPNKVMAVHRIVALTFLETDKNVLCLDVNHKDGNKLNNDIDNLEWVTRSENNLHAVVNRFSNCNRNIRVKNLYTGTISKFKTIKQAARFIGTYPNALSGYIHIRNIKPYRGKWAIRIDDDDDVFPNFDSREISIFGLNVSDDSIVIGVPMERGDKYIIYPSLKSLIDFKHKVIEINKPYDDYIYCYLKDINKYVDNITDFNNILDNAIYRNDLADTTNSSIKKPRKVKVFNKNTKEIRVYDSLSQAHKELFVDVPYNTLRSLIWKNNGEVMNFLIEFI